MKNVLVFFKPTNTLLIGYPESDVPIEVFSLAVRNPENYQVSLVDTKACSPELLHKIDLYITNQTDFRLPPAC